MIFLNVIGSLLASVDQRRKAQCQFELQMAERANKVGVAKHALDLDRSEYREITQKEQ